MAVGDLVYPHSITWRRGLLKFTGKAQQLEFAGDIASSRCFDRPLSTTQGPSWSLWRLIKKRPSKPPVVSLLTLLDTFHDIVSCGAAAGIEHVATPFSQILLLSGKGGIFDGSRNPSAHKEIEKRILEEFGDYIDEIVGIRVRCEASTMLGANDVASYFGRGIFVPQPGENPVGKLEVRSKGGIANSPLLLGRDLAGIYRGQSGVAIGGPGSGIPATSALLPLHSDCYVLIEPSARAVSNEAPLILSIDRSDEVTGEISDHFVDATLFPTQDVDMRWDILSGETGFSIDIALDVRPSRLWTRPPASRPHLEIVGVCMPDAAHTSDVDRWWIDLDAEQKLVRSAMQRRASSVVVEGETVAVYDWRELAFDRDGWTTYRLSSMSKEGCCTLRRADAAPLGYLLPPDKETRAQFGAKWWASAGYHLDWMDFSGGVETASGRVKGLAAFAAAEFPDARVPAAPDSDKQSDDMEWLIGPLIVRWRGP